MTCGATADGATRRLLLRTASVGDVDLQLAAGALRAGRRALLRVRATAEGLPVDLRRGAALTAIPERDLDARAGRLRRRAASELVFELADLRVGCHRFVFDFSYAGRTHTASFTQEVTA
jgi:hypothetical protein